MSDRLALVLERLAADGFAELRARPLSQVRKFRRRPGGRLGGAAAVNRPHGFTVTTWAERSRLGEPLIQVFADSLVEEGLATRTGKRYELTDRGREILAVLRVVPVEVEA